jgi:hypothetical protein
VTTDVVHRSTKLELLPTLVKLCALTQGLMNAETLSTGGFALAWNAFVAFWTISALAGGVCVWPALFLRAFSALLRAVHKICNNDALVGMAEKKRVASCNQT